MGGLGIPEIGKSGVQRLCRLFPSLKDLMKVDRSSFPSASGFSAASIDSMVVYFSDPDNKKAMERLLEHGVNPKRRDGD